LVRELHFAKKDVATIASWDHIPLAVEHVEGATFTNTGLQPWTDEVNDPEIKDINSRQLAERPPWTEARADRFTFALGKRYLQKHHPRFLFLSFNDSDEWGHLGNYSEYVKTLRQYDQWLAELTGTLNTLGEYGKNTCLVVTTDHGRGTGRLWKKHGPFIVHAENVWLYTNCLGKDAPAPAGFSHLNIRPTIEKMFGLAPHDCKDCGHPMVATLERRQ
jgi:hypothetical protein